MRSISLLVMIIACQFWCYSQEYPHSEIDLSRLTDDLLGFQDDDTNYEELYENLVQIMSNPFDLNTIRAEEIRLLHILNENQIQQLIEHRYNNGSFLSIYELQSIPALDLETIYKLLPFVKVIDPESALNKALFKRMLENENTYIISRYERTFETKKGYKQPEDRLKEFKGSDDKLYLKFRTSKPGDFSVGFTAEKDAGEQILWNTTRRYYGFDYFSYHAQVSNKKRIRNLILGDFQCQFAQGLILGGAFGLGKGAETITTTRRSNIGFLPYTSLNESGFYRGVATTYEVHKNILVSGFYSVTNRDASIGENDSSTSTISSLLYTGLHRNENEIIDRKKIMEKSYGAVLNVKTNKLDAGLILHAINFSYPILKRGSVYNQFTFQGQENINAGAFLNYTVHNFNFFNEIAKSLDGGFGLISGMLGSVHPNIDISLTYRKYDKNFFSFYTNTFAESSQPQNETGFYWGWKYTWKRKYSLAGYTDLFKFPWLGFRRYAPSNGYEWLLRFNFQPSRKISTFIQAREESKSRNGGIGEILYEIGQGTKRNYCLNIEYNISPYLKFKTRAQYSTYSFQTETSDGLVLLQDLSFSLSKFQFTARHALFDTDDFDTRHYVYENDVWLAYSLPAYYGVGVRNYMMVEYKVSKHLSCWVRYSRTRYTDRDEIGSGLDAIQGNTKNDIKLQVQWRF